MYRNARIKLTLLYSVLLIFICWSFSISIFFWFQYSLGTGYITQVSHLHHQNPNEGNFNIVHGPVVVIAGEIAIEQLRNILLILNTIFVILIPISSWYLTNKTLKQIGNSYDQQQKFVTNAAHELRTPLSIVSGEIELALNKKRSLFEYKQILTSSKEEIDRLTDLVKNLLILARGDQVVDKIQIQEVDITDLLNTIIQIYHHKFVQKKINITFRPATNIQLVYGSQTLLQTLFSNLIDNALKYTPEKGTISIAIAKANKFVTVTVRDTGVGIAYDEIDKIYNRFYRSDNTRFTTKGFGLGLSIIKSIVDRHKGRIDVLSQPGKGTIFTIYLPRVNK
jgi:signal transduction histidine kinase